MNLSLLGSAAILASAVLPPASALAQSPVPLYDTLDSFAQDLVEVFEQAKIATGQTHVVLRGDPNPRKFAAAQEAAFSPEGLDIVFVYPALRHATANKAQILFVVAHEFAHLRFKHMAVLTDAWERLQAPGSFDSLTRLQRFDQATNDPRLADLAEQGELEADRFALDVLVRAGLHPAHGAFVRERGMRYFVDVLGGVAEQSQAQNRNRTERIMDRVPDFVRHLPQRPVETFFP